MINGAILAIATSTGEAITTFVVSCFFGTLAVVGFKQHKTALAVFYGAGTVLTLALTAAAAAGHVFHGW